MKNSYEQYKWLKIRRQAIDHLLQIIHDSSWNEHLVLRGSLLLTAWLGDMAREPGDIDWVFRPQIKLDSRLSRQFFAELIEIVSAHPYVEGIMIQSDKISMYDIGDYDYADGKRILFPVQFKGLYAGTLQMDVVFEEKLFDDPIQTSIPTIKGSSTPIWSASKELSLAWKLLWLETDDYPQSKDLYDATLLAEQTKLPFDLLYLVLVSNQDWLSKADNKNFPWRLGFPWKMNSVINWDWYNIININYYFLSGCSSAEVVPS